MNPQQIQQVKQILQDQLEQKIMELKNNISDNVKSEEDEKEIEILRKLLDNQNEEVDKLKQIITNQTEENNHLRTIVNKQKEILEDHTKEITDSINKHLNKVNLLLEERNDKIVSLTAVSSNIIKRIEELENNKPSFTISLEEVAQGIERYYVATLDIKTKELEEVNKRLKEQKGILTDIDEKKTQIAMLVENVSQDKEINSCIKNLVSDRILEIREVIDEVSIDEVQVQIEELSDKATRIEKDITKIQQHI